MKILIAEDDATSRLVLANVLKKAGHTVTVAVNGAEAWQVLQQPDAPALAILDWMMPELDGLEVVGRVRARPTEQPPYLIMLTSRGEKADIIAGLEAGANDYLAKPFDRGELYARIEVGRRMIELQAEVGQALEQVRSLLSAEQEAQQRFELMFRHNPAPMALTSLPERRFTDANDAFLTALGYDRADLIGRTAAELKITPPEQQAMIGEQLRAQRRIAGLELQYRRRDGTTFEGVLSGEIISNQGQEYFLTVIIDITDRKQAEALRVKLEAQNRQFEKAESLGRMAGAIAHHFNNQLQAVMGRLELATMKNMALPETTPDKDLAQAMKAARRAAEMSSLMLVYLGQTPDSFEPLDLAAICARNLAPLREALPPGVTLETDLPNPGPVISANPGRVQQLLTNLVANAGEAIEETGVVHLTVTTVSPADIPAAPRFPLEWQPQEQAYACLAVADTGVGIAAPEIEKLFDPFFSTKFAGRGLGLAVVLGIVRTHSGAVTVDSQPGRGSVFRLFFPVTAQPAAPPQPPAPAVSAVSAPEMARGGTVLLVEDEELVRDVLARMLTRLGFTVLTAADGVEAVELFRQRQADIDGVLSDLSMPRMDGWATLTALRELAPDLPVVLSSGYDESQVMAGHHPQLPQAFLSKPYELNKVNQVIRQVLAAHKKQS